jgi:hypothetical protein
VSIATIPYRIRIVGNFSSPSTTSTPECLEKADYEPGALFDNKHDEDPDGGNPSASTYIYPEFAKTYGYEPIHVFQTTEADFTTWDLQQLDATKLKDVSLSCASKRIAAALSIPF